MPRLGVDTPNVRSRAEEKGPGFSGSTSYWPVAGFFRCFSSILISPPQLPALQQRFIDVEADAGIRRVLALLGGDQSARPRDALQEHVHAGRHPREDSPCGDLTDLLRVGAARHTELILTAVPYWGLTVASSTIKWTPQSISIMRSRTVSTLAHLTPPFQ